MENPDPFLSGRMACSYFDPATGILYVMEDTEENRHFDLSIRGECTGTVGKPPFLNRV